MTSALVTMQSAAAATGNGTSLRLGGYSKATLHVSGTFSGTVTYEGSVDGTNWVAVALLDTADMTTYATTSTAEKIMTLNNVGGLIELRARVSAYASGTITVKGRAAS